MLRQNNFLENVLVDIEEGIGNGVHAYILAKKYTLSERHLRRLFRFTFNLPMAGYIRSRRLAASINDLLMTNLNILDIALKYGFCYEQTYINAFKREFGITPGSFRRSGQIVNIKPSLCLLGENKITGLNSCNTSVLQKARLTI